MAIGRTVRRIGRYRLASLGTCRRLSRQARFPGTTVADHIEHRVQTPDGRTLAVAEWGDPAGVPVIAIHGTPGSRLSRWRDADIYRRCGVRRISFDRAGYGQSTRRPGRRVADIAEDVRAIADDLGIDRFAVTGRSGGGPHALACAALLPDRVACCEAVVSVAPFDAEGLDWFMGQTPGNVTEGKTSLEGEAALRALVGPHRLEILERIASGEASALPDEYELSESDRLQQAKDRAVFEQVITDGLRDGVDGWVDDDLAFVAPWGFDVGSIAVPTSLWYGRADTLVPAAHGDWLAEHIPGVEVFASEFGHFGDDAHAERELTWLTDHYRAAG
jgi:pimeloyl-ACP methyl ester carboxylesterase